ncbi:protein-disulfide reductase DsbD [Uliginosibacterium sp. H3]|uniref:Thiol:disulfide interchange protein DsbD n=1 Tax=Uliginosibacterium silvisoli TaxID=3114758 RepID=A0ABU6K0Z0_9RHOO|nr:protein-disulfide reductase DsbD [Uliginosibacterium sp. H3]
MSALRFLFACLLSLGLLFQSHAALAAAEEPLPPEQAFAMTASLIDEHTAEIRFNIAPGYYLYLNKFKYATEPGGPVSSAPQYPQGEEHEDKFFGKQTIFRNALVIRLPVDLPEASGKTAQIIVTAQGCTERLGVCYPPNDFAADLKLVNMSVIKPDASAPRSGLLGDLDGNAHARMDRPIDAPQGNTSAAVAAVEDDTESIADLLRAGNVLPVLLSFFGFGLLLAFTPCMLPMIPILSGIIVGHGEDISRQRALRLSSAYVVGMSLTYAAAGVAAGMSGTLLSTWLQNIWVLGAFALIFVVLALSMFDVFTLQLPSGLQARLSGLANQQSGSAWGVAVMGALSALIVGPCMAAPLAGTLLFIAQTGNASLGGMALFALAIGMGTPLIAIGVMARHWLPRPGPWMDGVKQFFGIVLLGTALWLVAPVLPPAVAWSLLATLIVLAGWLMWRNTRSLRGANGRRVGALLAGALLVTGAAVLIGGLLRPNTLSSLNGNGQEPPFAPVRSVAELDSSIAASGKPVMLDFYADWCVSCKEMEHYTFSDPRVAAQLAGFTLLRADVTKNNADDRALLKRFGLFGPPGIIFFDANGQERKDVRVIGYQRAERFSKVLTQVQTK